MHRSVSFRAIPALVAVLILAGCAGPAKLAERSEDQLVSGDHWKAWHTAVRALEKAPANSRARAAAQAAANSITSDWQRRIAGVAAEDSLAAAEGVLELAAFRANGTRWATLTPSPEWARTEIALRAHAARTWYQRGAASNAAKRPKRAYREWLECDRFVESYRDADALAEKARQKATTRVAILPFAAADAELGREVASRWRDAVTNRLAPPSGLFTRFVAGEPVESAVSVAQLGRLTRADAARIGRDAGAERAVWGRIGEIESSTQLHVFKDRVARKVVRKDESGATHVTWTEVPIEVVARVRTVTVPVECEVIATRGGTTLARRTLTRTTSARVVWTSEMLEGDADAYALVSDDVRASNPDRVRDVETRWKAVCGDKTTLQEVLRARRAARGSGAYDRGALPRFVAGAAFVMLSELPPASDLALAALSDGWPPLEEELGRLDGLDDVDLGVAVAEERRR